MRQDEFEARLRESTFFRQALTDILQSSEQALAIVTAAVGRQIDVARIETDLLDLQQKAASADSNPTRDRILNSVRSHIRTLTLP